MENRNLSPAGMPLVDIRDVSVDQSLPKEEAMNCYSSSLFFYPHMLLPSLK